MQEIEIVQSLCNLIGSGSQNKFFDLAREPRQICCIIVARPGSCFLAEEIIMLFTGLGRSVLGKVVASALNTVQDHRPRSITQYFGYSFSQYGQVLQPMNNIYVNNYGSTFLVRYMCTKIEPIWTNSDLKAKNALYTPLAFSYHFSTFMRSYQILNNYS